MGRRVARLRRLALDGSVRRAGEGRVLIGGSPLTLLRLTAAGAELIDRIQSAGDNGAVVAGGATTEALIDRLLDGGIVHPRYATANGEVVNRSEPMPADVTVVIPAYGTPTATLQALVTNSAEAAAVIVVDDASPTPIPEITGATVIRRPVNGGPGQARATGLEHVSTRLVAFVDADVELPEGWLQGLAAHFADHRVGLVAPRVSCAPAPGRLARFEAARSPLDLGPSPARVRAGTRVSYVPAAAIVCRTDAIRAIGDFDPQLRIGEDVDLVWRLDEAGWRIRYEPTVVVHHAPRPTLRRWVGQRYQYGTSAAPLAQRHPGALAPVRVSGWSAASWAAAAAGWPLVGTGIAAVTTALLARKLRSVPDGRRLALRLAGLGHLYAGRSLASGVTRAWWPLAAAAALISRRCRRAVLLSILVPTALDWWNTRPELDPATYTALHVLDDVSYGTGLAVGAWRARSLDAIRPDLTSWPKQRTSKQRPSNRKPSGTTRPWRADH